MCAEDFYLLNVSAPASIDNCVVRAKIACAWSFGRRLFPSHEAHTDSIPTRCARDGHAPLRAPLFSQVPAPEVPGAQVPGAQVPLCRALARADSNHRKSKTRTLSKSGFRRLATFGVSLCASLVTAADQQRATFFANAPSSSSQACDDSLYKCGRNTTLHTLNVSSGVWRLSEQSLDFYKCKEAALGGTPCPGGAGAGTLGEDYCREGHTGPLCSSCANESYYFSEGTSTRLPSR